MVTSLLVFMVLATRILYSQVAPLDPGAFFLSETPINATVETYWSRILKQKFKEGKVFPAQFKCLIPDSINVNEPVNLEVRGNFRRDYCYFPPLKLIFKKDSSSIMDPLKSIKLVNVCKSGDHFKQYLLKEFLTYKIYNLLSEKSFRVRLLNVDFKDSSGKKGLGIQPAFVIEDATDMAARNGCKEWTGGKVVTEATDRRQMTLVAVFEFMIGNTDWSVTGRHNIRLIQANGESVSRPFSVPYDFDYSGLVNTDYAVPDPLLNTQSVVQRVYRGYPRTMEELKQVFEIFIKQKDTIYSLINNFEPLAASGKKQMIKYLEEFYDLIGNPKVVKSIFIDHARTE